MKRSLVVLSMIAFVFALGAAPATAADLTSVKIKSVKLDVPKQADVKFLKESLIAELQKAGVTKDVAGLEIEISVKQLPGGGFDLDTVVKSQKGDVYTFTLINPNYLLWTDGQMATMTAQRFANALQKQLAKRATATPLPAEPATTTIEIWSATRTGSR